MDLTLRGQTALITGASSGIGRSCAVELGRIGAAIVVNFFSDREEAEEVVDEIVRLGGRAHAVRADVSREDDVVRMFAEAREHFGTLDILIANSGIQQDAPFAEMTLEQWQRVIDVNLTGQFLCMREAVRIFKTQGIREGVSRAAGKIIAMSSVHDRIPWAGHVNYAASKGGVDLLMRSLAQEVAPLGIRVNSISPGAIKTAINRAAWEDKEAERALLKLIPAGRVGLPEDIGRVAAWLASDSADYIHGACIVVDGGMELYPAFAEGG